MALTPQEMSDRLELQELLHRYCDAVDRQDWDAYRACFATDAHIDYSSSGGATGGVGEVADWLAKTMRIFAVTQHSVTNSLFEIEGDEATGRTYFYNPMTLAGDGPTKFMVVHGWYNDTFRRIDGRWRISRRVEETAFMDGPFRHA